MITIDTSGLIAAVGQRDPHHRQAVEILDADRGPYIIPVAALAEMAPMLETDFPPSVEQGFLDDLLAGRYRLGCGDSLHSQAGTKAAALEVLGLRFHIAITPDRIERTA